MLLLIVGCPAKESAVQADTTVDASAKQLPISITMRVPDPNWRLRIEEAYDLGPEIFVIVRLTRQVGNAVQMVTQVSDEINVATNTKPIHYYVIGKSWQWNNSNRDFVSIQTRAELSEKIAASKLLYRYASLN